MNASFASVGFQTVHQAAASDWVIELSHALDAWAAKRPATSQRNVLAIPTVQQFAQSDVAIRLVEPHLGANVQAVRGILFDKSGDANWGVGWHQDQMIPIARRIDTPGFSAWSTKQGVLHAKPPVEVLEQMLTVRWSLDDCPMGNGPLRVIPGSHRQGFLSSEQVAEHIELQEAETCVAKAGDALVMKPLLLHSSGKITAPDSRRRVLHIEYAADSLPNGLQWPDWSAIEASLGDICDSVDP